MAGKGGGTVEDVLIQFLGKDSLTNVGKNVEKALQGVQKQAEATSKTLSGLEKSASNLGSSFDKAAGTSSSGMGGFSNSMDRGTSKLQNLSMGMQNLQYMFMDFGLIMGQMTAQSIWDKFLGPAIKMEDAKSTMVFMGESAEAVDRMNTAVSEYAAAASKVSQPEIMGAWQMVRLQSKVSAENMEKLTPILGDTVAQFKANGRTAEAASMAIADGIAGQFKRLQEIGIKQEDLRATGLWKGTTDDVEGFMKALEKIYSDRGLTGIAQKTVSTADYLDIVSEKLELAFMKIGEEILPYVRDFLVWFVDLLENGAGPIIAWTTLIGMLGMVFIFVSPFILNAIEMVGMFTSAIGLSGVASMTFGQRLTLLGTKMKLISIDAQTGARSMTRFGTAISLIGVAAAGAIIGYEIFNYFWEESQKKIAKFQETIDKNNESIKGMKDRYEGLHGEMKDNQWVYDKEAGKWIQVKDAVDKTGQSYKDLVEANKNAKWSIAEESGWWNQTGENLIGTSPIGIGMRVTGSMPKLKRQTPLGKGAEVGRLEGGLGFTPAETQMLDYIGAFMQAEEEDYTKKRGKRKDETDLQFKTRLQKKYNDALYEQVGITADQVDKYREAHRASKRYDDAMAKLNEAMGKAFDAWIKLIASLFGITIETGNAEQGTRDLSDRIIILAGYMEQLAIKVERAVTWWNNLSTAIANLKQHIGSGDWLGALGDLQNIGSGDFSSYQVNPEFKKKADNVLEGAQKKITAGSPLRLVDSTLNTPELIFPQFTPDFVGGIEAFNKNQDKMGSGTTVIHHHNENITLDTRHMGEGQLVNLLTNIYSGINQRSKITPQGGTQ